MSTVTAVPLRPVKRAYVTWLIAGILLALVAGVALAAVGHKGAGIEYRVLKRGTGTAHPTDSDVAFVLYEGRLTDGTVFDKSEQPTPLPVGGMIKGFTQGLKLMTKGSKYRFTIPPALGYGAEAKGPIPANSTLVFDVELIDFIPEQQFRAMQQMMMMQQQQGGGAPGAGGPPPGGR